MKDNRCVHLDFHTSEKIKNIGSEFNHDEFVSALKEADLDSITVFAKCHHGNMYYYSDKYFTHPYLTRSLLDDQIAACREAGVSAKIYISAGFDEHIAMTHPEWLQVFSDGSRYNLLKPGFKRLCFNTPYLDILAGQTEEVMKRYMPDGIFYDIVADGLCTCNYCLKDMQEKGLDYRNRDDLAKQAKDVFAKFTSRLTGVIRSIKPDTLVFYNAGNFPIGRPDRMDCCDQLEAESLPTGGWGYDHFPLTMSYIRRKNKNCIGMTGKFHTAWGEFGGFKYKDALLYEGAQCLAFDASLSVGDQLHPNGKVDWYTYENVGNAMRYIHARDAWRGGTFMPEFAILARKNSQNAKAKNGAGRIFFEEKYLFDVIDNSEISTRYPLIVLPEDLELDDSTYGELKKYVQEGGKLLAIGRAPMYQGKIAFDLGAKFVGEDQFHPTYFRARYSLKVGDGMALVVHAPAYDIEATGEVLADKISPYFQREGVNFCSHLHTPCDYDRVSPAITAGKDGIYVAVGLFEEYASVGSLNAKQLILPLMEKLLGAENKTVVTNLPSSGKVTLYKKDTSYILHLLYANTIKRGEGIEIIEDLATLADIHVTLRLNEKVKRAICRPSNVELPLTFNEDGTVSFTLEKLRCSEIVELTVL